MVEVTAEMIERGRGADPRTAAERRRVALKVREAREKLTSSGSNHRAFELELMRLFAERRKATGPSLALLGLALAVAVAATQWASLATSVTWLGLSVMTTVASCAVAARFLRTPAAKIDLQRWKRRFVGMEAVQGCVWALILLVTSSLDDAQATTFALITLLLVAAMNATTTAALPGAVYASLVPITLSVVCALKPIGTATTNLLLAMLALGTQVYFVVLARKLYASTVQGLSFQADKDDLIAELEQAKANSDLARLRAEESNVAKSRFLATMSHELRTPLNAILGFSEVMKSELLGEHSLPAYRDYAGDIHASGQHLLVLINEILDLSRIEAGRYELHEEAVDLFGVIDECRRLVALRAKKKDIAIGVDAGTALPRLWADVRAVRQIVLNLLSNAIKFTPQGGRVTIKLAGTEKGDQTLTIADNGAGIPDSELPTVMATFGRGSFAQKHAEEGAGLGLPIVKGLVDLHGGTFTLTSKIRVGTEVMVRFPAERVMSALPPLDVDSVAEAKRTNPVSLAPVRSAA